MKQTFYDLLGTSPEAGGEELRRAYQDALAPLVRRLREARRRGEDTALLEEERRALAEAWEVLSEPARRRLYDRFLELVDREPPLEAEELWAAVADALVDPAAQATLELVRLLTELPVGPALAPAAPRSAARRPPEPQAPARAPEPQPARPEPADSRPEPALDPTDLATLVFNYGYSGELLRRIREARGISVEEISSATRISRRYIEAIEADDYASLPSTTFVRGYLKEIARLLEIDAEAVIGGYLARMNRVRG